MRYPDVFEDLIPVVDTRYLNRLIEKERQDLDKEMEKRQSIEAKKIKRKTKTEICY